MPKIKGKGTKLQTKVATVWTDIANRVKISPPAPQPKFDEITDLDSTYVERAPVIVDLQTVSLTGFFSPNDTLTNTLRGEALSPSTTAREFKVVYTDGNTTPANDTFSGFVSKFAPTGVERDKFLQYELEIQCNEAMAFTAGTP